MEATYRAVSHKATESDKLLVAVSHFLNINLTLVESAGSTALRQTEDQFVKQEYITAVALNAVQAGVRLLWQNSAVVAKS